MSIINPVYTSLRGSNADLFGEVARMYFRDGWVIADVTWGQGRFWKKIDQSKYNLLNTDINPDFGGVDYNDLPYDASSLDGWVFDPPYMAGGAYNRPHGKHVLARSRYANSVNVYQGQDTIPLLYRGGMTEGNRVLRHGGIAVVKCQDSVMSMKQRMFHIDVYNIAVELGWITEDLFVLQQSTKPTMMPKWTTQNHARKNHSYFWVFRK